MAKSNKAKRFQLEAIVYDFDGVMTDNKVLVFTDGQEAVICNRSDGWAVGRFKKAGVKQGILSTETNPVVGVRARKLGLSFIQGCDNKGAGLKEFAAEHRLNLSRTVYVGNDDNDLPAMKLAGFVVCPADASPNIKKISNWVAPARGGEGVVRALLHEFERRGLIDVPTGKAV